MSLPKQYHDSRPEFISAWLQVVDSCLCIKVNQLDISSFSFAQQLEAAAARASEEEKKRLQTQMELQDRFNLELEREKMVNVYGQQNHRIDSTFLILNWC